MIYLDYDFISFIFFENDLLNDIIFQIFMFQSKMMYQYEILLDFGHLKYPKIISKFS